MQARPVHGAIRKSRVVAFFACGPVAERLGIAEPRRGGVEARCHAAARAGFEAAAV
jgi:hypothetical protein